VPEVKLEPTPDILAAVVKAKKGSGNPKRIVGFAAESQDLLENARNKLEAKKLDLMIANDISAEEAGFSVDTNRVTILSDSGDVRELEIMSKTAVAEEILDRLETLLTSK
jgi:phosphopantothenoylcysteine decarboxylase/phosphopantothenate--cysteine ligase